MNESILNIENQKFINSHLNSDIASLLFQNPQVEGVDLKDLIEQIEAKKKCEHKLPIWYNHKNIYYPNKLNIEQTSSEITAEYKSRLIRGESLVDITGGFGVDTFYFSKSIKTIHHCEMNADLSEIASHNFKVLGAQNIETHIVNGLEFVKNSSSKFDWIYVDPSRRHDVKGKVFLLSDCLPDVPSNLETLFSKTNNLMIKTSPLLDIAMGMNSLKNVKEIHCVAVNNEMKELLWILSKGHTGDILVHAVNLPLHGGKPFSYVYGTEKEVFPTYSEPKKYLYEPNAAIMKSGAFNTVSRQLGMDKLHPHSHLYTSDDHIEGFPGRTFLIQSVMPYSKKTISQYKNTQANITTRNFPESVASIRKKYGIKDGGTRYLFLTTSLQSKIIIEGKKEIK